MSQQVMLSREVEQFMENQHKYVYEGGFKIALFGIPTFYKEEGWGEGLYNTDEPKMDKKLLYLTGWKAEIEKDSYVITENPEDEKRQYDGYRLYPSKHENPFDTFTITGYTKEEGKDDREEYLFTGTTETLAEFVLLHKLLKIKY